MIKIIAKNKNIFYNYINIIKANYKKTNNINYSFLIT